MGVLRKKRLINGALLSGFSLPDSDAQYCLILVLADNVPLVLDGLLLGHADGVGRNVGGLAAHQCHI